MSDDYLWDRSGPADPEVERLERLLGRYRHRPRRRRLLLPLLAAAVVLIAVGGYALHVRTAPSVEPDAWRVTWLAGDPGENRLAVGSWLETGEGERARIDVADIGRVDLDPRTRVRLLGTGPDQHRLELARGRLSAFVVAPPRLFVVATPAADAIDLGCAYDLEVDDTGDGVLRVASGYVELDGARGAPVLVPRGASCRMTRAEGPGLPWYDDAPEALRALDASSPEAVEAALDAARPRDALTLWHLLSRMNREGRERVLARLEELDAMPDSIDRVAVLEGDPGELEAGRDRFRW